MIRQFAGGEEGASATEFAFIAPVFAFFAIVCLQFAAIFFAYLSVLNATRDVVRWLAFNPNTVDSTTIANAQALLPPDLDPAQLTISISPACSSLVQNKCPNRAADQDIAVTLTYNLSSVYFMPTQFNFVGGLALSLPSSLPPYTLHMQVEPT